MKKLVSEACGGGNGSAEVSFERALSSVVSEVVHVVDLGTPCATWCPPVLLELLAWTPQRLAAVGGDIRLIAFHGADLARIEADNGGVSDLDDGQVLETRFRLRHADGGYRWMSRRVTPLRRDADGVLLQVLAATCDISDAVQLDERLTRAALHDTLTGLPTRDLLLDRLASALQRRSRSGGVVPVLFCDLDGFKRVNDTSGHRAGDEVLVATADRLRGALRPQDTVARVGGDEFVIVLEPSLLPREDREDREAAIDPVVVGADLRAETLSIVARLIDAVSEPVNVGHGCEGTAAHSISVSIGVAFAAAGSDPDDVLRQADSAMYRAKARGKGRYQVFDGSFRAEVAERGHIQQSLRAALLAHGAADGAPGRARDALSVVYQPIFDLSTMQITGVEALARLTDAFGVAYAPDDFIPVAEASGLIGSLGREVLAVACRDLAAWHREYPSWSDLGVAVNVSARQVGLIDLVSDVRGALTSNGLAGGLLTLELSENALLDADRSTVGALTELQAEGVRISIDDFGTGYASLRYLAQLPVCAVKVDQSFTAGLPEDPACVTIVRAVAALARDLGFTCVVEGIEKQSQLQALPAGVHGQGFLLGPPVTAAQFAELLGHGADRSAGIRLVGLPAESQSHPRRSAVATVDARSIDLSLTWARSR